MTLPRVWISLALLLSGGCLPIPIPHTERVAPAASGHLQLANGVPLRDTPVLLTADSHDGHCDRPASQVRTDSTGAFQLAPSFQRKSVYWATLMEPGSGLSVWLCASPPPETGLPAPPRTYLPVLQENARIDCLYWVWQATPVLSCNSPHRIRVLTGGTWGTQTGRSGGTYRIVLVESNKWGTTCRVFVHWVPREPDPTGPHPVVAELNGSSAFLCGDLGVPSLMRETPRREPAHWQLTLPTRRTSPWGKQRFERYLLGNPGQITLTAGT
jgi:hypothetical protein